MKDFAIKPSQTLNCRQEKPVDGSSPNGSLDQENRTHRGSFCHDCLGETEYLVRKRLANPTWRTGRGFEKTTRCMRMNARKSETGPRIAAILSIVETCRPLQIPIRDYLACLVFQLRQIRRIAFLKLAVREMTRARLY